MKCTKCNGLVVKTYVGESEIYAPHIPAGRCVNCGKHWFPPPTKEEMESGVIHTAQEVGDKLGVTRQRVDQIMRSAFKKMAGEIGEDRP